MGEYARFNGREVKIGTCESMYYLRADQRHMVRHIPGNVNPNSKDALSIRFRFPFPDEDAIQPGEFDNYDRGIVVPGMSVPDGVDHGNVQFHNNHGYLVSLPCPEGKSNHGLTIHRNGFNGAVLLKQQKLLADGRLVPVCACGGCGSLWRMEDEAEIRDLAQRFIDGTKVGHVFWHEIARRVLAGAALPEVIVSK